MKILLVNQYGADSSAPTGRILQELKVELIRQGHKVEFIHTTQPYGASSRGWVRISREILAHLYLGWKCLTAGPVDLIVSLTSPACLPVTIGMVARAKKAKHFHWVMDLYPDVADKLGEVKNEKLLLLLHGLMQEEYQESDTLIVLDEDMRDYVKTHYGVDSVVIPPTPPPIHWPAGVTPSKQWLYSGNFGRAHEIQVLLQVQKALEARGVEGTLVLQGQGAQFNDSRKMAMEMGVKNVVWREPVPLKQLGLSLLESSVLVVTRKAELKGILLPSKLVAAELSGRSILWIGDTDGKTAAHLRGTGHGVFGLTDTEAMTNWLTSRLIKPIFSTPTPVENLKVNIAGQWAKLLK